MKLNNKAAIVTGGANGIGSEIAVVFAGEGAKVVIADIVEHADDVLERIRQSGGDAQFVRCDVADEAAVEALIDFAVDCYGRLDIMVNNAAIAVGGTITEYTEEQWLKTIGTNLGGVFHGCKHAIRQMKPRQTGAIINMSSVQAYVGFDGWTAYAAAKGGVLAMTQQLAVEFAPQGIRVNSISPGTVMTPLNEKRMRDEGAHVLEEWIAWHPIGRIGTTEEVAQAALFLASDEAGFITGVDLKVDGGMTLRP